MKKIGFLVVIIMLMALLTSAQAEVKAGSVSVTPFVGLYNFETNEYDFDNSFTMGLRAGYNFTRNLGIEGFFSFIPTETQVDPITKDDDVSLSWLGVEGLYHFFPTSNVVPFFAIGVGGIHYDSPNDNMNKLALDYGAGLKIFLPQKVSNLFFADDVAVRADIRHVIPMNETYNDFMATIGVTFSFGGEKKCADNDGDGVCDDLDKCSSTPAGRIVDHQGCPADSEKGGIVEDKDKRHAAPVVAVDDQKAPAKEKVTIALTVEFDTGKTIVREKYYDDIKRVADYMNGNPDSIAVIEGHTDNVGNEAYNKLLSEKRASNVGQYLIDKFGIDGKRITATGLGEKIPIAGNDTEEGRKKNRRVEAIIEMKK
ncbi:MAG: OmpA family protein [Smithella sp.]